jgi:hypothetical protein
MNAIRSAWFHPDDFQWATLLAPIVLIVFWIRDLLKGQLW